MIIHADRAFLWVSLVLGLLEEKIERGASHREVDEIHRTRDIYTIEARNIEGAEDA
ncbi:ankyrin repeat protein [Colletotrichum graminicola]|nr:ankyrin repeat protein [Colletotrichum graminicola]